MVDIYINSSKNHRTCLNHYENVNRINKVEREILNSPIYSQLLRNPLERQKDDIISLIISAHGKKILKQFIKPKTVICFYCGIKYCSETCPECNLSEQVWYIKNDTYVTNRTEESTIENVGILMDSVDNIINGGKYQYLLIRPPGHHCYNKGQGFCILNNIYITATYALSRGFKRVLIFDYDYHHFDGTYKLGNKKPGLFLISMHAYGINNHYVYPGTGFYNENKNNVYNIPLKLNCEEDKYKYDDDHCINLFDKKILSKIQKYNPDLILISNGLDAHRNDPLSGLNLTRQFYVDICTRLKSLNVPLIYILEGGYNPNVISDVSLAIINKLLE